MLLNVSYTGNVLCKIQGALQVLYSQRKLECVFRGKRGYGGARVKCECAVCI